MFMLFFSKQKRFNNSINEFILISDHLTLGYTNLQQYNIKGNSKMYLLLYENI